MSYAIRARARARRSKSIGRYTHCARHRNSFALPPSLRARYFFSSSSFYFAPRIERAHPDIAAAHTHTHACTRTCMHTQSNGSRTSGSYFSARARRFFFPYQPSPRSLFSPPPIPLFHSRARGRVTRLERVFARSLSLTLRRGL